MPSRALTHRPDEAEFTEFVRTNRPLLQGVAYLLVGDVATAAALVEVSLAQLFQAWPAADDALVAALQRLLAVDLDHLDPPWQRRDRFELLDGPVAPPMMPEGIVAELAGLEEDQRRALVLERYAGLNQHQVGAVLGRDLAGVAQLRRLAQVRLAARAPQRMDSAVLDAQLADAVPYVLRAGPLSRIDATHGRQLLRQQRLRRTVTVAAVLALIALGAAIWVPRSHPSTTAPVGATPTASRLLPPPCGSTDEDCRARTAAAWRNQIAAVVRSYLDPKQTYFKGVDSAPDSRYESPGFWTGEGGVLGLNLVPKDGGATFVYLQIATDEQFAIPCGKLSAQQCGSLRFMDGNRFTLTDSTTTRHGGMEVQYSPAGVEVITVVAIDVGDGRSLMVDRGDLIKLVQDQRLHLPHA
jgi:DNA-directed RNA polymerase specialized sigma24 family protein